ncbi:MAG: hypothetical protein ABI220_02030 [Candidatus Saccharimonadales bacterium]
MINYSAIPVAKSQGSPWDSLKLAASITAAILGIMVLGAAVTAYTGHRGTIMALISGVLLLGFFGIIIGVFIKGFRRFNKQKKWMRQFAKDNGWQYDESKRTVNDLVAFPPIYSTLASNWNNVRCTVSGEIHGMHFELVHITYVKSTGLIGVLSTNVGKSRFAWTSVLYLEGNPNLMEKSDLIYERDNSYTYVVCGLNALYRHEIQSMFESVA